MFTASPSPPCPGRTGGTRPDQTLTTWDRKADRIGADVARNRLSDPDGRVEGVTTISIHLLGDTREFQAEELPPVTSAHTGRQLRRVALEFRVPSKRQDELDAELKADEAKDGHPLRGTDVNWSVSNTRSPTLPGRTS
jgi:hypothetical protein